MNKIVKELQTVVEPDEETELKNVILGLETDYTNLLNEMEGDLKKSTEREEEADRLKREVTEIGCSVQAIITVS